MRSRFPLESVLRYRNSIERREWLALQSVLIQLQRAREELKCYEVQQKSELGRQEQALRDGVAGAMLQFLSECHSVLESSRHEVQTRVQQLQQEYRKQQDIFLQARQARKVIEELRNEHYQRWLRESERREQAEADEAFLLTHGSMRS